MIAEGRLCETTFEGRFFTTTDNWFNKINVDEYKNRPVTYLEIGAHCGGNIVSVANTYCNHEDSKIHCIDPWIDYEEYPEFKGTIDNVFNQFNRNIVNFGISDKTIVHRGFSNRELLKFKDEMFDIIYIDGNHEPNYVLEDAILSFRKLKTGGVMILDDYSWRDVRYAIDAFLHCYKKRIDNLGIHGDQAFIIKH